MLIDLSTAPVPQAQLDDLASQLRLPGAYLADDDGAARLRRFAEVATAIVERRIAQFLLSRRVEYRVTAWPAQRRVPLPVSPVSALDVVGLLDADGNLVESERDHYRLEADDVGAFVVPVAGAAMPSLTTGQSGFVRLQVGYGVAWSDVPADLRLAVTLVGAALHDHGTDDGAALQLPFGALSLLEPYRRMRLWA